ncbi:MAG: ADP-ribosylglycohydrolase family protein, partial [Sandaracinaceae bacterium]|nr:ADP-ribosylglycohydrolase family protein [Sandaracinaceae bacterium]
HSDEAYTGALAIALTIQDAWQRGWRGRDALLDLLLDELPDTRLRDRIAELRAANATIGEAAARFGTSGYVVESVPLAIHAYCAAAEGGDSLPAPAAAARFSTMVAHVVQAGGDCDSVASMAAQCLGALRGERALPADQVAELPAYVGQIADALAQTR